MTKIPTPCAEERALRSSAGECSILPTAIFCQASSTNFKYDDKAKTSIHFITSGNLPFCNSACCKGRLESSRSIPNKNPTALGGGSYTGRGRFTFGEYFSPYRLQASLTRSAAQMRTPFCNSACCKGRYESSRSMPNKNPTALGGILFGAGRGIRTPVPFGQTVFKTASL